MEKAYKAAWKIALVLLCVLMVYSFFHITGRAIQGVEALSADCAVTVKKYPHLQSEKAQTYTLQSGQIAALKQLLLDSDFTRSLANAVYFDGNDAFYYDILVDYGTGQDVLSIHGIDNYYLTVTNQFGGKHLKINNPDWTKTLEEILAAGPAPAKKQ